MIRHTLRPAKLGVNQLLHLTDSRRGTRSAIKRDACISFSVVGRPKRCMHPSQPPDFAQAAEHIRYVSRLIALSVRDMSIVRWRS